MSLAEKITEVRQDKLKVIDGTLNYKQEYNGLLERERKAEAYLNNEDIPLEEREKHFDAYKDILNRLNDLLGMIGSYKPREILEGFKL